jgi:hypothetical protein
MLKCHNPSDTRVDTSRTVVLTSVIRRKRKVAAAANIEFPATFRLTRPFIAEMKRMVAIPEVQISPNNLD